MKNIKTYVAERKEELKKQIEADKELRLVIIQIGDNPASNSYIKGKLVDCEEVGIKAELFKYTEEQVYDTGVLVRIIEQLNEEEMYNGIIVQLPLPEYIDVKAVQLAIDPKKDIDGFHPMSEHVACTPLGVVNYLKSQNYNFEGKNALVVGRSDIVGKPLAKLLTDLNSTVTIAHSKTPAEKLKTHIANSDIIFTAIDKIEFYDKEYFLYLLMADAIIDIGLGRNKNGKLRGNLSSELVANLKEIGVNVVSGIGGVGLLTRLQLLENIINAKKNKGD